MTRLLHDPAASVLEFLHLLQYIPRRPPALAPRASPLEIETRVSLPSPFRLSSRSRLATHDGVHDAV